MSKIFYVIVMVGLMVGLWVLMFALMPKHGTIIYDCRIAEISPDFPIQVKEECRKRNSGRI
jgi:hypothetical protein